MAEGGSHDGAEEPYRLQLASQDETEAEEGGFDEQALRRRRSV